MCFLELKTLPVVNYNQSYETATQRITTYTKVPDLVTAELELVEEINSKICGLEII